MASRGRGSRNKGANGEREAAKWLQKKLRLQNTPERNLEQYRKSNNSDLIGIEPFSVEIKRCEQLDLRGWWLQAKRSVDIGPGGEFLIPVVMFRQNRKPWRFLIEAEHIGVERGYIILEEREFVEWAKNQIKQK